MRAVLTFFPRPCFFLTCAYLRHNLKWLGDAVQGSQCAHSSLQICVCLTTKQEPTTCRVSACDVYGCVRATFRYSTCASPGCVHCIVWCGWMLRRGCMQICNPKITLQSVAVNASGWPSSGLAFFFFTKLFFTPTWRYQKGKSQEEVIPCLGFIHRTGHKQQLHLKGQGDEVGVYVGRSIS